DTSQGQLRACVDWLQATFDFFSDKKSVCDMLGVDECKFIAQDRGLYGYKTHYKYGHISILMDGGQADMGIHIQFSGQGCREYEEMGIKNWRTLLKEILAIGGKVVRLDVAIDDIAETGQKNYFTVDKLLRKVK